MMTDGVPGVRGVPVRGSRPLILYRMFTRERVTSGSVREPTANINEFVDESTPTRVSGRVAEGVGFAQRGIAEIAQRVIAAA